MTDYAPAAIVGSYLGRSTSMADERGWHARVFASRGSNRQGATAVVGDMVQSRSRTTVRGLHYRRDTAQWKQIRVIRDALFDVPVDLRPQSATYPQVLTLELSDPS